MRMLSVSSSIGAPGSPSRCTARSRCVLLEWHLKVKTLEPFFFFFLQHCALLFRCPRFPGAERRQRLQLGGQEKARKKEEREKGGKSLAGASSLKRFGERWHVKLESSVSPSPLWLHIKHNREKILPTKINDAWGTPPSLNNTDYLVCARTESVRISSRLIKVLLLPPSPSDAGTYKLSNYLGPTFQKPDGGAGE